MGNILKRYNGTNWETVSGAITGDTLPIGAIVAYSSNNAPTNWLICDGSAVNRVTYADLFSVIGTTYGAGDGTTTFNLPNNTADDTFGNNVIIKAFQSSGVVANVSQVKTTSDTDTYSCNYIDNLNTYSTEEKVIGTWIDGKPIYRKVLNYSGVITHVQTIPHGISNFNELAGEGLKAIMYFNSRYYSLPLIGRTNDYVAGVAWINGTNIEMILGSGNANNFNCSINFVIEYTKTTD